MGIFGTLKGFSWFSFWNTNWCTSRFIYGINRFAKGFFDPLIELYRPVPPLAWAPLIISVLGIDNTGKVFLLFMVLLSIMIISWLEELLELNYQKFMQLTLWEHLKDKY